MSIASIGITAAPMPARTIDITAPLSAVLNTINGSTPSAAKVSSTLPMSHSIRGNDTICTPSSCSQPNRTVGEVAAATHEHVRVVEQLDRFDRAVERSHPVRQVELAGEQSLDRGLLLEDADVDGRVLIAQLHDDLRQQHVGHALERADVDPALAGLEPLDGIGGRLSPVEQFAGMGQHELAERRDAHRLGAAGPIEDGAADRPLQGGDLLADGALGVAESLRSLPERALGGDGVEGQQVTDLEAGEGIEQAWLGLDGHAARIARTISDDDRLDRRTIAFRDRSCIPTLEPMSAVPFDLEQLAFDLDRSGFPGREPVIRQVVHLARMHNVGGAAVGVLADQTAPEVARMRAFGIVATALLPITGDRLVRPLAAVA